MNGVFCDTWRIGTWTGEVTVENNVHTMVSEKAYQVHIDSMRTKGAVTQGNFSCNLSRNFVAIQVARSATGCLNRVTLGNVSLLFWKLS